MTNEDEATTDLTAGTTADTGGAGPPEPEPQDSLTALHADLLAGMVDGTTAAARLEALMDEMNFLQSTYVLPAVSAPADVERGEPMPPIYADVADDIPGPRGPIADEEDA